MRVTFNEYRCFHYISYLMLAVWLAGATAPSLVLAGTGEWKSQKVDPDQVHSTSIALDTQNRPHISYHDYTSGELKYARFNGRSWVLQIVDPVGNYGGGTSLALDSNDTPHISYYDETNVRLKYAYWTGSAWHVEPLSAQWSNGRDSSLALDSNGYPHISWSGGGVYHLMYTKWTGSAWETTDIESDARHKSLVLDSNGHPHISYYVALPYNYLKYATYNGISWNTEVVDTSDVPDGSVGSANSMALDSNNRPHIAYSDDSNKTVKYAKWTGTEWVKETVDSSTISYNSVALALDSSNTPHISYATDSRSSLHYAHRTGSVWVKETVDPNDFRDTSIVLDSKGCPYISYATSGSEGGLNYAYGCSRFPWPMFLPAMKKNSQP